MKRRTEAVKKASPPREYDFSSGVRGKYASRYAKGSNVVVISPDVADVFPDAESVNQALHTLAGIIRQQSKAIAARS